MLLPLSVRKQLPQPCVNFNLIVSLLISYHSVYLTYLLVVHTFLPSLYLLHPTLLDSLLGCGVCSVHFYGEFYSSAVAFVDTHISKHNITTIALIFCFSGGVCSTTSLDLDQEDPPERTKLDDPHVLSGTYSVVPFMFIFVFIFVSFSFSFALW